MVCFTIKPGKKMHGRKTYKNLPVVRGMKK
nr:MAG TPA: hypothetical protein [Bacteriophage sp.]DAV93116.1 MAG TPA: hypothetical protein [Caudoviricetes sp.]DAW65544.1 MAG TPA: hypothetical protein [Bacteriophage sp.]